MTIPTDIVIDTGPLLCALVWNYVQVSSLDDRKRQRLEEAIRPVKCRGLLRFGEQLSKLIETRRSVETASYVIAELQGLSVSRLDLKGDDYSAFWKSTVDYLAEHVIESPMSLRDVCADDRQREALMIIGPTDTALLALARMRHAPILSIDGRTLAQRAEAFNTPVYFPEELLSWA